MVNKEREYYVKKIMKQLDFCIDLTQRLKRDIEEGQKRQNEDPYDSWIQINGRSRYVDDIIRIRRELSDLKKMLEG